MKVLKYYLDPKDDTVLDMFETMEIVHVEHIHVTSAAKAEVCLWAVVNPKSQLIKRTFRIVPTGRDVEKTALETAEYFITFKVKASIAYKIYHIFEIFTSKSMSGVKKEKKKRKFIR